jgi:hypothetical protein
MASAAPHARLINAAARRHLKPLGCTQKGSSRIWLLDRDWFVSVVEFQPSKYGKGSFLNVGAHFLWTWDDFISFDLGYRVEGFQEYVTEDQFSETMDRLASRAADELRALNLKLSNLAAVVPALWGSTPNYPWTQYHCAVAMGLSRNYPEAKSLLSELASLPHDPEWQKQLGARCGELMQALQDHATFDRIVIALVSEHRSRLGLPAVDLYSSLNSMPSNPSFERAR